MPAEHNGSRSRHYSEDRFYAALSALRKQSHILYRLTDSLLPERHTGITKAIGPLIVAAHASCESIILLSRHEKFADALVTARTVLTTAINVCFICAKGQGAAERAMRHAIQKAYRDLDRHVALNGMSLIMKWHGPIGELGKIVPGLESALKDFTTKGGKEKRTWTDENIEQQLGAVAKKIRRSPYWFLGLRFVGHLSARFRNSPWHPFQYVVETRFHESRRMAPIFARFRRERSRQSRASNFHPEFLSLCADRCGVE